MSLRTCFMGIMMYVGVTASEGACTNQELDEIVVDGKKAMFLDCPLIYYWNDKNPRPEFDSLRSSNWKGFTVGWEIKENKLWVTEFEANQKGKVFDPKDVFRKALPIHAIWVNGPQYIVENLSGSNPKGFISDSWQRIFLVDGIVRKRTAGKTPIKCTFGYVGITPRAVDDEIVINEVQDNSPAAKSGIRPGTILSGIRDTDGATILFQGFSKEMARQCMRGLVDDRLILLTRKSGEESTSEIELQRD